MRGAPLGAYGRGERGDAGKLRDGAVQGVDFGGRCVAHDGEYRTHTNVMQAPESIALMETLAERLKTAREALGLSQVDLAKRARVSAGTIGNLEAGIRKTARNLTGIAAALGVRPEWLADGKGPMKADTSAAEQAQPWPFESISPADWGRLAERQKGVAEDAARQAIERLGASGKRAATG